MLHFTPAMKRAILTELVDGTLSGAGVLTGLKVALSTNTLPEDADFVLADELGVPDYTGYAVQTLVPSAVYLADSGEYAVSSGLLEWQPTDALGTPATIQAVVVYLDSSPDIPYIVHNLETPETLSTADDAIKFVLEIAIGIDGEASDLIRID